MHGAVTANNQLSWVSDLADALIREIFQETAGILLVRRQGPPPPAAGSPSLVSIYSRADGAYVTELVFRGELPLFFQVAANMQENPSPSLEDAADYTLELFNIFCGRFISEVYRATGITARFHPPQYLGERPCGIMGTTNSIYYLSQDGQQAQFSWTSDSVEQLLTRRTTKNEA